jgi:hypothetical protein
MDKKIRSFFVKYKKLIVPLALDLASVFIVFGVIFPQISTISNQNSEIEKQNEVLINLRNSLNTINSQDVTVLDENFSIATRALPVSKDVALIFSSLTDASSGTNNILGDFSLTVGGVYGRAAQLIEGVTSVPSVGVTANVSGSSARNLALILEYLLRHIPLTEVKQARISQDAADLQVNYFYKPVDVSRITKSDKVTPLSQADQNTIEQMKDWGQ